MYSKSTLTCFAIKPDETAEQVKKEAAEAERQAKLAADKVAAEAKAAEQKLAAEAKAAEQKAAAEAKAAEQKVAEAAKNVEEKVVETAKKVESAVAPDTKSDSGLGVVKGGESGGRVLPKEEVDPSVLNMLKVSRQVRLSCFDFVFRRFLYSVSFGNLCADRNTTKMCNWDLSCARKLFSGHLETCRALFVSS